MAILHGNWIAQDHCFFIWGETWRHLETVPVPADNLLPHPYSMTAEELVAFLESSTRRSEQTGKLEPFFQVPAAMLQAVVASGGKAASRRRAGKTAVAQPATPSRVGNGWRSQVIALPTQNQPDGFVPQLSNASPEMLESEQTDRALFPWQVEGFQLTAAEALTFFEGLPLGQAVSDATLIGSDLCYWSHIARWVLDLLARAKFLPEVHPAADGAIATWQLLLDSAIDQSRLRTYIQQMPAVCRAYQTSATDTAVAAVDLLAAPQEVLLSFLSTLVNTQVKAVAQSQPLPTNIPVDSDIPIRDWLVALGSTTHQFETHLLAALRLQEAIATWTAPLQNLQAGQTAAFRTCFVLEPPSSTTPDWQLRYCMQATDNDDVLLAATTIWENPVDELLYQNRTLENPQENFLAGLGRAARLYQPIHDSLQTQRPQACVLDPIQAFEFIKAAAWRLQDSGFGVILPPSLVSQQAELDNRLGLSIRAEAPQRQQRQRLGLQSLLNFQWELTLAGEKLSQREFQQLLSKQSPLVEINGKWVELRPQDVKAAQTFFKQRPEQMSFSVEDALRISTGDTQVIEKLPVVSFEASGALKELINTLTTGNQTLEPIPEPEGFAGQLRPYQARGVSWLAFLEQWGLGACLADDMGLGKTIQLIAFLLYLRENNLLERPTLLVCPTSVIGNWEREVRRFGPKLKTLVYHGDKRPQGKSFAKAAAATDLVITSYALVHRDLKNLKAVTWQGIVLDEAQNIKNPEAKQSQAVREIAADFRITLTGTPIENRLAELWSILDFLNPGYLGPRNFFQRRFATPIERYGDTASLKTLRSLVQPFILRRLKTDRSIIQELPEKQEMTVFCGLTAEQASLYQQTVEASLAAIEESEGIQRHGLILSLLVKLKQICNHPAQFLKQKSLGKVNRSAKLMRLDEMLEELIAEGDRALIFTQFSEWGKLLKAHLERYLGQETLFLYGSTSQKQREAMVDRFQHDPNAPKLFILSLKAGGVGLNLTRANHVFHFDRWWNPAVENQATDRAFRIGQTRNVQVHKFVCTGTLEERIHELIENKKALSEQVVSSGEQWLTDFDSDQLRNLLLLDRSAIIDES
ncbi:DEAD/DEAH box helicase [Almyronema epifaneia]|uniref:DEAD/DEAH box helicase n=1 Tax=Almyronema epifaneia S1 TaxID=2991925 RepID=A0ABW6IB53_9CYAN